MPYIVGTIALMAFIVWLATPSDPDFKRLMERTSRPYSDVPPELRDPNQRIFEKGEAGAVRDMNDRAMCTAVGGTRC